MVVEKQHHIEGGVSADDLQEHFVSKLVFQEKLDRSLVSTDGHLPILQALIKTINPFCRYTKVITPCYQKKNRQKVTSFISVSPDFLTQILLQTFTYSSCTLIYDPGLFFDSHDQSVV